MKSVVFAYHNMGCIGLEVLLENKAEILALFTHEDDAKEKIWFRKPADLAREKKIPVFTENPNNPKWVEKIRSWKPDFLFSFYYRSLLDKQLLEIPRLGALNLHGSLLPKYRGRAPLNWVLVNGEVETGVTLHYMNARADAGDIVAQKRVTIEFDDDALLLSQKLERSAGELLRENYPLLERGQAARIPQDESKASKFGRRTPEDGRIDWRWPASRTYNLSRALAHPFPGAFSSFRKKKWLIWKSRPVSWGAKLDPGTIHIGASGLFVDCGEGRLWVERCQIENEEEMPGIEFLKRMKIQNGERCE